MINEVFPEKEYDLITAVMLSDGDYDRSCIGKFKH